jgi:hypothetical protein
MKAMNLRLLVLALGLASVSALAACSSDDSSNPTPTPAHDSGTPIDSSLPPTPDSGGGVDAGPGEDTGPGIDAALPDAGSCVSDASTCNSCYTPVVDPVNGCSPAAANCVKFDNTRVPAAP